MCLKVTFVFAAMCHLSAAREPEWLRITSPNFELYTTAGEKKGREAILYFEQVRDFFRRMSPPQAASGLPVRIIAFNNDKEFKPYSVRENTPAYYLGDEARDYIVMRDVGKESYPVAVHEYYHLLVKHSGMKLPVWLNEGLADVNSTLTPVANKIMVGNIIPGRAIALERYKWLPIEAVLNATHDSAEYNEKDRTGIFYAQSWLLTHMLYLTEQFRPRFGDFLTALQEDPSSVNAFAKVYGRTPAQLHKDMEAYRRSNGVKVGMFDGRLEKPSDAPAIGPASEFQRDMALAELLMLVGRAEQAKAAYGALASTNPQNPEVEEALGVFYWRNQDRDGAVEHYAKAVKLGSKNSRMYWDYVRLIQGVDGRETEMLAALRKLLNLEAAHEEARLMLGMELYRQQKFAQALAELGQIKKVLPERASSLFNVLAYCHMSLGDKGNAKQNAEKAKKYAKSESDRRAADSVLEYLEYEKKQAEFAANLGKSQAPKLAAPEPEPLGVPVPRDPQAPAGEDLYAMAGNLKVLECIDKSAKLHVQVGSRIVKFLIDDPANIRLEGTGGAVAINFTCGPQKGQPVVVRYQRERERRLDVLGVVRVLEFRR